MILLSILIGSRFEDAKTKAEQPSEFTLETSAL